MLPNMVDSQTADELELRLWDWARATAASNKDLSACLDILRNHTVNGYMTVLQSEAAQQILSKKVYQKASEELPQAPVVIEPVGNSPKHILASLSAAGMLVGRKGETAMELLSKCEHWTDSQERFARSLAVEIRDAAIVNMAIRNMETRTEFLSSVLEAYETWGSYTPKQLGIARAIIKNQTGADPLAEEKYQPVSRDQLSLPSGERADDDDIPF